ncbi:small ubiquitin-related modifier 1 [Phtheirospermum japonicum]|uniref:Small ubiquitin-related modifier 1 n=1 Tax=Phtheirospermum japonicum TaxID=374723 RepID=A0A830D7Y1_9LAMI|nr:small ubiquitin-related modifier 1 [Phtheirospermum japonicum]
MGLPVPTYWGALDLIKQKTTHEAYWFSRANDEDRLYWLMRLTPKGATHAFHHWRRTEAKLVIQQSFKNSTEQNLKKETDDDDDVILAVDSPSHINLTVKTLDGSEVYFKVEPHSKLEKLMQAYREHVNIHSLMFLFDGSRLRGEQTPYELEMKDGDVIRVMHSLGGQCHVTS